MKSAPLSSVCDVIMGQAPAGTSYNTEGIGLPLLAGAGDFGFLYPEPMKFTDAPTKMARKGDLILCIRATIGDLNWADKEYCLGRGVAGLRPKEDRLDKNYLWHWLLTNRRELEKKARGSTFKQVSRRDISELELSLPGTIAEQRRIAAILDKADGIRRKRDQALALADEFLRTTYAHLVGFKNPNYPNWKPQKVQDLADRGKSAMRTGPFGSDLRHSEFVDEGVAVLGIDNAVKNHFAWDERRFITQEKYEKLKRYQVFPGDVLITIMGTTGRSAVVPENIPEAITTKHLATITCDRTKVVPEFLSFSIHSDPLLIRQIQRANKGAIMAGLNLGIIKSLKINLPPLDLQKHFAQILVRVHKTKEELSASERNGIALQESLSQRAFGGEL